MFKAKPEGDSISPPAAHKRSRRSGCIYHPSPSRLAPAAPSQRGRLFIKGKMGQHYSPPQRTDVKQRPTSLHHVSIQWHSQPKRAPAAKPPQLHPAGQTRPRETKGQAPSRKPKGTANPNAHRRHSRRSCIRQDKRAHARLRAKRQAENQRAQPTQTRTGGIAAAAILGRIYAPTQDKWPEQPQPTG